MTTAREEPVTLTQTLKARLVSLANPSEFIIFDVSPSIAEERTVNYQSLNPVHMPGSIWMYQNTESRTFSITAKMVSRTPQEARKNLEYHNRLRGWCMPYFGATTAQQERQKASARGNNNPTQNTATSPTGRTATNNLLGSPPDVLSFSAYSDGVGVTSGSSANGQNRLVRYGNISRIPVVIRNFAFTYPNDVDYIPTSGGGPNFDQLKDPEGLFQVPFPMTIEYTIGLLEVHSPLEYATKFDLSAFKQGILTEF
jgi:hypothetical protein